MGTLTYTVPVAGTDLNSVADPEIATALSSILTWANGNIDAVNLSALLAQAAGVNQSGQVVKGVNVVSGSESRTNTAYGTLTTADQVTGIVLPTNGLLAIGYQAAWQQSVGSAASAAIFIGANQLQIAGVVGSTPEPVVQAVAMGSATASNYLLATSAAGLTTGANAGYTGDATTGQIISAGATNTAGLCYVFAAAGTYTISVQFKASSGSVTAANRKLWVQALAFS